MSDKTHCDDYAESPTGNIAARWFIFVNRLPHSLRTLTRGRCQIPEPTLFADFEGRRVRVVMASRMGDLGITHDLTATDGYETRVGIEDLSNFSETP